MVLTKDFYLNIVAWGRHMATDIWACRSQVITYYHQWGNFTGSAHFANP